MRYDFGRCLLDTVSRKLTLDGTTRHLSPKAFELLRLLVEDRPRVVTKAELMQRLWPDTFVEEANLPVLVAEARAAVGDAGVGQIIKTHHRVGYGFAADVHETRSNRDPRKTSTHVLMLLPDRRRIALSTGINIVGRDRDADLHIDDPSVSRRHARIVVEGDTVSVEDLGSKNGTRVGGVAVSGQTILAVGDIVTFGGINARFEIQPFDDTATSPILELL
jgi:DNA-binding winged helix-turn-helix (wHTH) protein